MLVSLLPSDSSTAGALCGLFSAACWGFSIEQSKLQRLGYVNSDGVRLRSSLLTSTWCRGSQAAGQACCLHQMLLGLVSVPASLDIPS